MTHFLRFALTRLAPFVPYALSLAAVLLLGEAKAQTPRKCGTLRGNNLTVCYGDNETADKIIRLDPASIENFPNTYIEWRDEKTSAIIHFTRGTERARELPLGMLTAWFAEDSGTPRTLASQAHGQLHVVIATQKWPTTPVPPEGCTESDKAYFYIIQQPRLTPGPTPSSSSAGVCNGTSITLSISGSPAASLTEASIPGTPSSAPLGRTPITFNTEFVWTPTPHATFPGTNNNGVGTYALPNAFVTIGVSPEPTNLRVTLNFSYARRYRAHTIEGFGVSSKACPGGVSGEHGVDVFPSIAANAGAIRSSATTLCTGKTITLEINPRPPAGVAVKRWERLRQGSQGRPVQLPAGSESHRLEATVPRGFEPGMYAYSAVLGPANSLCELTTAPLVIAVQQFDLDPLVVPDVCPGGTARFSSSLATSAGDAPVFTWQVSRLGRLENIHPTNDPMHRVSVEDGIPRLTIAAEHLETVRSYRYKLKAAGGSCEQETPEAAVPAGGWPIIRTDPSVAAAAGCAGETLDLFALGGGPRDNIKYQWQTAVVPEGAQPPFDNLAFTDLGDEKESTEGDRLAFPYSEANRNKAIRVKITHADGGCSAYSRAFKPSYSHRRPVITADLTDKANACLGTSDTFSLTTENTDQTTTYQWFRGTSAELTVPGRPIEGAAAATYPIVSYAEEHNDQYFWVVIRNGDVCPSATSRRARVTTKRGPTLGTFSAPTRAQCAGPLVRFTMTGALPAPGQMQVTYQWMEVNPERQNQPEYIGTERSVTTSTAPNPVLDRNMTGKNGFRYIAVLFGNGCELRSPPPPPLSAATNNLQLREIQPVAHTSCTGGSVTLSIDPVEGTGAMPFTYQWRRTDAADAALQPPPPHGRTLTLTDLRLEGTRATKTYTVTVTDASGCAVTSTARTITVRDPEQNSAGVILTTDPPPRQGQTVADVKFCPGGRVEYIAYYQPGRYIVEWEESKSNDDPFTVISSSPPSVVITPGTATRPPYIGRSFSKISLSPHDPSANPSRSRDGYRYRIKVTDNNVSGCPYSSESVTVSLHPAITLTRPADQNICEPVREFLPPGPPNDMDLDLPNGRSGTIHAEWTRVRGRAEFTVLPPGGLENASLYTYQWRKDGNLISSSGTRVFTGRFTEDSGSKLIIRGAQASDNGMYSAEATSIATGCKAVSEAARLTVNVKPHSVSGRIITNGGSLENLESSAVLDSSYPFLSYSFTICAPRSDVIVGRSFANGDEQGLRFHWQEARPLNANAFDYSEYADITADHPYADFSTVTTPELKMTQAEKNAILNYRYRLKVIHGEPGCVDYYPKRGRFDANVANGLDARFDHGEFEKSLFEESGNFFASIYGRSVQWRPWNYPPSWGPPPFHAPGQPDVPIDPARPLMPVIKTENNCAGNDATLQIQPLLYINVPYIPYDYQVFYQWVKKPTLETPDDQATLLFSETAWPRSYPPIFNPSIYDPQVTPYPGEIVRLGYAQDPIKLTIRNLQASDEGYYSVRVRIPVGGICANYSLNNAISLARATAPWVKLTAQPALQVDSHPPDDVIACSGGDAETVFEVTTTASSVVWKQATATNPTVFEDFALPGREYDDTRHTNRLVLPASYFAGKNGYRYRAEVRNSPSGGCMIYSPSTAGSRLEVRVPPPRPMVTAPARVCEGGSAVFKITNLPAGTNYQWMREDAALSNGTDCAGANTQELTLTNVQLVDDGASYTVRLNGSSNGCTPPPSEPHRLFVVGRPPAPPMQSNQVVCQKSESRRPVTLSASERQFITPTWEKQINGRFEAIPASEDTREETRTTYDPTTGGSKHFMRNTTAGEHTYRLVFTSGTASSLVCSRASDGFTITVKAAPVAGDITLLEAACSGTSGTPGRRAKIELRASGGGPFPDNVPAYSYELLTDPPAPALGRVVAGSGERVADVREVLDLEANSPSGNYKVKITALTATAPFCEALPRPDFRLEVLPTPVPGTLTVTPWTICQGERPILSISPSGAQAGQEYRYEWIQGTTSLSGDVRSSTWPLPSNLAAGLYTYKVRVTAMTPATPEIPATATTPAIPATLEQRCSAESTEATLTVNANPSPTWEVFPDIGGICSNAAEVRFKIAEVADASYQWQVAPPIAGGGVPGNEHFDDIPGATAMEYILLNPRPSSIMEKNGYYYRVLVSLGGFGGNPECRRASEAKKLTVKGGYFLNLLPPQVATCKDTHYTYLSEFYPPGVAPDRAVPADRANEGFSYQWEFKRRPTDDFVPLPTGNNLTPAQRGLGRLYKYDIQRATPITNEGIYRVTVRDVRLLQNGGSGCTISSQSVFKIGNAIIEKQPQSQFVCRGGSARLVVRSVSKDVSYYWVKWTEPPATDMRPDRQIIRSLPEELTPSNTVIDNARGESSLTIENVTEPATYRVLLVSTVPGADVDRNGDGVPDVNYDSYGNGYRDTNIDNTVPPSIENVPLTALSSRTCYQISDRVVVRGTGTRPEIMIAPPAPGSPPNACFGDPAVPRSGDPYVYAARVTPPGQEYAYQWKKRMPDGDSWLPWAPIEGATGQSYTIQEPTERLDRSQYSVRVAVKGDIPVVPDITTTVIDIPLGATISNPNINHRRTRTVTTRVGREVPLGTEVITPTTDESTRGSFKTVSSTAGRPAILGAATHCRDFVEGSGRLTLVVKRKPTVTLHPENAAVCRGTAARFTAAGQFDAPPATGKYEWFREAVPSVLIMTDNSGNLQRSNLALNADNAVNGGKYYAKLTNTFTGGYFCTAKTREATLTIHPLPTGSLSEPIVPPPGGIPEGTTEGYQCAGEDRHFRITPSGALPPYTYNWGVQAGTLPTDAVESYTTPDTPAPDNYYSGRLTLPRVPSGSSGNIYMVTITDSRRCRSAEVLRSPALIVKELPSEPWLEDKSTCTGQTKTFTVLSPPEGGISSDYTISTGTRFLWKKNGVIWPSEPPEDPPYTRGISRITPTQPVAVQDRYTVTVINTDGCKRTSPPAWLRVTAKPVITSVAPDGNGNCSNAPIRIVAKTRIAQNTDEVPLSGVLFQWFEKSPSAPNYTLIPAAYHPSATGNPLVVSPLTPPLTLNGYRYQVKAISPENRECFTVFPETPAAFVVNPPPPRPEVYLETPVCEGLAAKFRITPAPPAPFNPTDYQWKRHKPSSGNAPPVTNTGTGITYEIPVTSRASDDRDYYTVTVTDNLTHCQASSSPPITLRVHERPTTAETVSYEPVCGNEKAVFKIINPLPGIVRRQWEERTSFTGAIFRSIPREALEPVTEATADNPNPTPAPNSTADSRNLEISPTAGKINYRYRVKSFNAEGCWRASADDDASNAAVLTVKPLPVLRLTVPEPVCPGVGASFRVVINNMADTGAEYKWERKATLPLPPLNGVPQWSNEEETFPENTSELQLVDASRNMLDGTRGRTLTREKDNGSLYKVTVTAANGCKATSEQGVLRVFPTPRVGSGPDISPSPVCSNQAVTVQITNPGGSVQWEAAPPGNTEIFASIPHSNPRNPTDLNAHVVSAPLNGYKYRVKLTSSNGCSGYSSASPPLAVNAVPTAESIPDKSICTGEEVTFTARASGGTPPYTYLWRGQKLVESTVVSVVITDQNPDPDKLGFTASLAENGNTYDVIVRDANQCEVTPPAGRLTVNTRPAGDVPSITGAVPNACSNQPFDLELVPPLPRPGISWEWQEAPPGGQFTTLPDSRNASVYQVLTAGKNRYRYRIEVRDSYCTAVANDAQAHVLNVHEPPVIAGGVTCVPPSVCGVQGSVTYSVVAQPPSGSVWTYQWETLDTRNGVYVNSGVNPQMSSFRLNSTRENPLLGGRRTRVRITDRNGCVTVSEPSELIVTTPPVIGSLTGQTICSGAQTEVLLRTNSEGAVHYKWSASPGPGITGASARTEYSANNVIAQTLDNGATANGTVTYSVTPSLNGCPGDSQDVTVTVRPKPGVTVSGVRVSGVRSDGNRICAGKEFTADLSSPTANTRYKWNVEASDKVTGYENQTVSVETPHIRQTLQTTSFVNEPVTYWITPTVAYGSLLCEGETRSLGLTLRAPVRINKHPQPQVACPGSPVELSVDAKGTPDVTYEWLLNGTKIVGATEPTHRVVFGESGYNARYTVRVSNVCTSAPDKLSYDAELSLLADFGYASIRPVPATPQYLEPVTFSYTGPPAASYEWDFGDNTPRSPFASPVHNYAEPDKSHRVSLTVVSKKGNCRKTITLDLGAVTGKAYDPYTGDLAGRKGIEFYPVPLEEKLI